MHSVSLSFRLRRCVTDCFLPSATVGYVFTGVCLFTGGGVQRPAGGRHLPHLGRNPSPHQTATAADGTHPTGMHSCCYKSHIGQWRIQDFPEEGAQTHKVGLFCKPFAENCMKNKKIGPPWIRQCWLLSTFFPMNNYVITEYFVM